MVGIIAVLSSCTMIPEYNRPEAPVPSKWQAQEQSGAGIAGATNGSAGAAWQDFYLEGRLRKIIELALANNRDLRAAALAVEKTRAMYRIQRADLLPAVNATAYGTRQEVFANIASFGEKVDQEYYSVNLGFSSYELDLFGRIRSLKARALEQFLASVQARRSMEISLMAEIAGVYLNLAADRERLRLARDTWDSQETTYAMIERRFDAGESSELDLRQAQSRLEAARVDIAKYAAQAAMDENALDLLAGTSVPAELLPADLGSIAFLREIQAGVPSEVLQRRPDILQAESQLKAANANIGAARAAFFPSIILTGSYGTMDDQLSGLFKSGSYVWNFTPQISLPIFNTGKNMAGLGAAKAERDITLAQYEKSIQAAFREVADALVQREALLQQVEAQESLVDAVAAAFSLANARYLSGLDSYMTVLDSQRALYGAQQGLIALRLARLANVVTLYKVLGGV